jgi:hypothetical protein
MVASTITRNIVHDFRPYMPNGFDQDAAYAIQWSTLAITQSTKYKLSDSYPVTNSFKDLAPTNILSEIEYAYFVQFIQKNTDQKQISATVTTNLFSIGSSFGSLMNP